MNTLSYKKNELKNMISHFNLQQVESFYVFINEFGINKQETKRCSLAGIWKNSDFDNEIFESELKKLRNNIANHLDSVEL